MKRVLKELYGSGILFFYFIKWPYFVGYIFLYNYGLNNNFILDILWFFCGFLIVKDFYRKYKELQSKKEEPKE
ncbi:MAG: hypothetical protein ACI9TV_001312 [Sulfurimonas sp.]|jgi:hypothetical protein